MSLYPRIIVAGTQSGVGKTTLTLGLLLVLKKKGFVVQPYKVGPDYIDSEFHTQITGLACRNLDSFLLRRDVLLELFERQAKKADFSLIEGVMGLFDGLKTNSQHGSTSHLSKILNCPVILILDVGKMSTSAAAMALGYKNFDRRLNLAGFILNKVGNLSHYQMTKQAIETKTGLPVLGYLPKDKILTLPERHLGLTPVEEINLSQYYQHLSTLIEKSIDVDAIIMIGKEAKELPAFKKTIFQGHKTEPIVNIAVAYDKSFHFYYQDNLDILEHFGAKLIFFSPLKSEKLPDDIDGIYIGGGFPELFASDLTKNKTLRKDIKIKSQNGMPIYAECGGLMYLMDRLVDFEGREFKMVGVFSGVVKMDTKIRQMGYGKIKSLSDNILCKKDMRTKGHNFHWSYVEKMPKDVSFAFEIERKGEKFKDGFLKNNTLASYIHLHFCSSPLLPRYFIKMINGVKPNTVRNDFINTKTL